MAPAFLQIGQDVPHRRAGGAKEVNNFMDGNDHKDRPSRGGRFRKQKSVANGVSAQGRIITFCKTHRSALFSGFFILIIVALLIGITVQLQGPAEDDMPAGETSINYSAFLSQVNEGNVLAVTVRGNHVNALLVRPLGQAAVRPAATLSAAQRSEQAETWARYTGSLSSGGMDASTTGVDPARMVYTSVPANGMSQLLPLLQQQHVTIVTQADAQTPGWLGLIWKFAPLLFLLVLLAIVLTPRKQGRLPQNINEHIAQFTRKRMRRFDSAGIPGGRNAQEKRAGGPAGTAGKMAPPTRPAFTPGGTANAQPVRISPPPTTFADVAGIDEVRTELEEIVQFLRTPEKFDRLGARIPRGALLVGAPGTGKTLLARAVAGEAGVPFFSISASEFVEMFVGVGASRVRDLFNQARQAAPAVIFIDEIDAVGRKRAMKAMGNEERDQTLNQLLVEMDGFNASRAVVVLAATNRVDILDKALLRPGRFDRHITVSLPDRAGRQAILALHTARTPLHEEVSLERLARLTTGMSGADLANLVNEAALCAARKNRETIDHACFEDALARVQLGALRPLVMTEAERRVIAYHEGGHALVAYHLREADTVNRVTILPRGQSLGVTQFIAEEDRYNYSREMLMAKIAVGLGGRVAEELTLGRERVTTGAENDFQVVTQMARRMVTHWGMSDEVGVVFAGQDEAGASLNMSLVDPSLFAPRAQILAMDASGRLVPNGQPAQLRPYAFAMSAPAASSVSSPDLASTIDREVRKILDEGHAMARRILQEHAGQLQNLADALMEHEQLDRAQFESLLQA
ncbi:MAG TPA: ATP-dependent zinc metalloprotease FtsH [Ktedonobacteraceae bacterium]|nr:ATP-dependent zinc metalloprotease FtsH [Ktedonobacteraceae bacterium]